MANEDLTSAKCPPVTGCSKTATQCVAVSSAVTLAPTASLGSVTVTCQGNPEVVCVTNEAGTLCTVTMTEKLCISLPVQYGVTITEVGPKIDCGENCGCK